MRISHELGFPSHSVVSLGLSRCQFRNSVTTYLSPSSRDNMFPRILLLLAFVVSLSASTLSEDGSLHEVLRVEGGPPGVVWAVQVSDIHISKWKPERGRTLRSTLGHALNLINPAVVLITGDLTEAKNQEKTASQQSEEEWIEYRDSLQKVVAESGIPLKHFNDLRGNHDTYGVPRSSNLDYFSKYSISAALNRSRLVQSVTVEGRDGHKHLFVGFDDSVTVGLRSPSNAFGHPTDKLLAELDIELKRWENADGVTKIVFGHFPMSFTTSTESGQRPEEIMANNDVSAYLCGHLHTKFGRRLYKRHKTSNGEFWEWEVGDLYYSHMLRVLAIDNGDTSFVDVDLTLPPPPQSISQLDYTMPTIILQTHPLDSRFMLRGASTSNSNSIRALVFSEATPISVTARIYDLTLHHSPKLVNQSSMKLFTEEQHEQRGAYYYTTPWEHSQSSGMKYGMKIVVEGNNGVVHESDMRVFSVEGKPGEFHLALLAYIYFGFAWERVYPVLLWTMVCFILASLLIPRFFLYQLQKRGKYEEWVVSVFSQVSTSREGIMKVVEVPFWVMVEGARNTPLWVGMMTYMVCLAVFPWFYGRVLGDEYPLGYMSLRGWTVQSFTGDTLAGLGVPDIMGIVLPYVYAVVFPLLLLLSALSAERVACEFHTARLEKLQRFEADDVADDVDDAAQAAVSEKRGIEHEQCRLCKRFVRKGLFVGCLLVAYNHWRLCSTMLGAYGPMALVAAPAYAWGVPALLMFTICQTSKIRSKLSRHEL